MKRLILAAALAAHGRAGVPLYLYYPPGGGEPVTLPQILDQARRHQVSCRRFAEGVDEVQAGRRHEDPLLLLAVVLEMAIPCHWFAGYLSGRGGLRPLRAGGETLKTW